MQVLANRAQALRAELLAEQLEDLPTDLAVPDFERWTLKLAVHVLHNAEVAGWINQLPKHLQLPEIMALEIKARIIGRLPGGYVSTERNPGLFGGDSSYTIDQPIPSRIVLGIAAEEGMLPAPGA